MICVKEESLEMGHIQSFLLKEIELVGVLPLVNMVPENPKLKKMKKRIIESK